MDWDAIKQEYISTNISQRELAEKYGVSVSSLGKKCASEGWSGLRKKFRKKVEKKTMEKISRKKSLRTGENRRLCGQIGAPYR